MERQERPHVLVIDDHPTIATRLCEMVVRVGFRASSASGGREGVAEFQAAQSAGVPFAAVITDLSMADLNGLAVAAAVKGASPSTAVVLLTAYSPDADDPLPPHIDAILTKVPPDAELRSTLMRLTAPL
jgi:CheY-like chemotaxis protein